jgi:nitrous oxidase accessory protein NosD
MWTDNNIVYHNNFIGNAKQVAGGPEPIWSGGSEVRYSICQWDNGGKGNFWSDYNGTDANRDSIGDTPYVVNEKNTDNFPLVNPTATLELTSPMVDANFPSPTASAPIDSPTPTATSPSPEPFPTVPVIAGSTSALVVVVGAGLSIYRKKHRH